MGLFGKVQISKIAIISTHPSWDIGRIEARSGRWEHFSEVGFRGTTLVPVARVSKGDLFKANPVPPIGGPHMKMSADDDLGAILDVPGLGGQGAAPGDKTWNPEEANEVFSKRKVVDEEGLSVFRKLIESFLGVMKTRFTPLFRSRIGCAAQ